jgi:hypothetical protein
MMLMGPPLTALLVVELASPDALSAIGDAAAKVTSAVAADIGQRRSPTPDCVRHLDYWNSEPPEG